jgi:hypothetical protein
MTAMFNALSISFPKGEKHFMNSIRAYKDDVSKEMAEDIHMFCIQEATHTREHIKYNKLLCELKGYNFEELESVFVKQLDKAPDNNKLKLASTTTMEHITATLGASILKGDTFESDNPVVDMWKWHSLEEVEHKTVSYDVYKSVKGTHKILRTVMRFTIVNLLLANTRVAIKMLRHDKQFWKLSTFKGMFKFFFSKKGVLRSNYADYKSFFDVDFDPKTHGSVVDLTPWKKHFA